MKTQPDIRTSVSLMLALVGTHACSNGMTMGTNGPITAPAPYLTSTTATIRQIVITAMAAHTQTGETASCTLEAELFDTSTPRSLTATSTSGECTAYAASESLNLSNNQWVCAGAVSAEYGGHQENLAICPQTGATVHSSIPIDCTGLSAGASVHVTSGEELPPDDLVTDLDATLTLPGDITITAPTTFGITSWPPSGDVQVAWTSANSTAALVLIQERIPTATSPIIVCRPQTNGQVTLSADILTATNARTLDVMVRVFSYSDTTATAEMGHSYHLYAGVERALNLHP